MRILHVHDIYRPYGGAEKYLLDTCQALEEMGHNIAVMAAADKEHISVPGRSEYFVKFGSFRSLKDLSRIQRIIKKENPQVIHLHNTGIFLNPFIIYKLTKLKPIVATMHDVSHFCLNGSKVISHNAEKCSFPLGIHCFNRSCFLFNKRDGFLENVKRIISTFSGLAVAKELDKIIVPSRFMYNELLANGLEEKKIVLLPHYVEKKQSIDESRCANGNDILWVGEFDDEGKGCREFIETLNLIRDKTWKAKVVGEGRYKERAVALAKKFDLEERIEFTGRLARRELDERYRHCSLTVVSSTMMESFGLVGIEAMSFGKPVIGFDAGGTADWLIDGEVGFLVKRGDVRGLADRIAALLDDKPLAMKLGREARLRVEKFYEKKSHTRNLIKVYKEVLGDTAKEREERNEEVAQSR